VVYSTSNSREFDAGATRPRFFLGKDLFAGDVTQLNDCTVQAALLIVE